MAKIGRTKLYKEPRSCSLTTEAAWWHDLQVAAEAKAGNHTTPNSLVNEGIKMVLEKYKPEIEAAKVAQLMPPKLYKMKLKKGVVITPKSKIKKKKK